MTAFVGPLGDKFTPESIEIDYQLSGQWSDTASNVPVFLDDGSEWDTLAGRATLRLTPTELQSLYTTVRSGQPLMLKGDSYALGPDINLKLGAELPGETGTATIFGREYQTVVLPDGKEWLSQDLIAPEFGGRPWSDNNAYSDRGLYYSRAQRDAIKAALQDGWRVPHGTTDWTNLFTIVGYWDQASLRLRDPRYYNANNSLGLNLNFRSKFWANSWIAFRYADPDSPLAQTNLDASFNYHSSEPMGSAGGDQTSSLTITYISNTGGPAYDTGYAIPIRLVREPVPSGIPVNITGWAIDGPADATASLYDVTLDYRYSTLPAPTGGDLDYLMAHGESYPTLEMDGQFVAKDISESWASSPCERAELKWYCRGLTTDQAAKIVRGLRALRGDWYTWTIPSGMVPFGYPTNTTVQIKIPEFKVSKTGRMLWEVECRFVADGYSLAFLP